MAWLYANFGAITISCTIAFFIASLALILWGASVTVGYGEAFFVYTFKSNERWYLTVNTNGAVCLNTTTTTAAVFFAASAASQTGFIHSNDPFMLGFVGGLGSTLYVGADADQQLVVKSDQTLLCVASWPIMYNQLLAVNIYASDLTLVPAVSDNGTSALAFAQNKEPNVQWYFQYLQ
jgi:hypothetical protein